MPLCKYYKILGIEDGADAKSIRNAYRNLAKSYHPDKNPSTEAAQHFIEITEAYEVLTGKREAPTRQMNSLSPEQEQKERAERIHEARKRYENQLIRDYLENELYYRKISRGKRWKLLKLIALFGIIISFCLMIDHVLPRHFEADRVSHYNLHTGNGTDGQSISLIKTERGDLFWINNISYALYREDPSIWVERSWIFHNPISIINLVNGEQRSYRIDFNYYRFSWLFMIIFLLPGFTMYYKRKSLTFTILFHLSYYFSGGMMLYYLITNDRWAHLLSLGFF